MKRITLDTNILLRAVFGTRTRHLITTYEDSAGFYSPDTCFAEAKKYIPLISTKRGFDPVLGNSILTHLSGIVQAVDRSLYEQYGSTAKERISHRDGNDWPIVATALLLDCPVWTEDQDFFGSGIPTWTTQTIELYLRDP